MPKLKKTADDLRHDKDLRLTGLIRDYAVRRQITGPQIAKAAGMAYSTFGDRMRHPETWRRGELMEVFRVLAVPEEDKARVEW